MGRALTPTSADNGASHDGHCAGIAAEHVFPFGRYIDELIERQNMKSLRG